MNVTVTFDRIGRNHDVPPCTIEVDDQLNGLAVGIQRYAHRYLLSRDVSAIAYDDGTVSIMAGFRDGGTGRWTCSSGEVDEAQR